jgi:hypothetical protein
MNGKQKLSRKKQTHIVLTEGDALADLNGTRRPDNHIEEKPKKTTKTKANAKSKN